MISSEYRYGLKPGIMTIAEAAFFNRIQILLGNKYFVFPQVHWSSIFEHKIERQWWQGAFGHINGKSVDFVVCDKKFKPLFAIELDDWSHRLRRRKTRDAELERIVRESGFTLLRIDGANPPSDETLAAMLRGAVDTR